MRKILEINLVNTHYYLHPEERLDFHNPPHATIQPSFLAHFFTQNPTVFITPCQHMLHLVEEPENTVKEGVFLPKYRYLEVHGFSMLEDLTNPNITPLEWMQRYWNEPFLLTHPIYQLQGDPLFYIFSSKHAKAIPLPLETDVYETAIENGCYSVGNGLLLALSMVALGKWKETDFLQSMTLFLDTHTPLDSTLPFYTHLYGAWNEYIEPFPYHLIDHIFAYTFQFHSPTIYRYFYNLCKNEDQIVYHLTEHLPSIFISTIFSTMQREDQYMFLHEKKHLLKQYNSFPPFFDTTLLHINFSQRIHYLLKKKRLYQLFMKQDSPILKQFLYYIYRNKNTGIMQLAKTFLMFDKKYPARRLYSILQRFMEILPKELLKGICYQLLYIIVQKKKQLPYQLPSRKFLRSIIFRNSEFTYFTPFPITFYLRKPRLEDFPISYEVLEVHHFQTKGRFTTSWKEVLHLLDKEFGKSYRSILTKRIARKFLQIQKITKDHSEGNILQFLMDDYYRKNPEELWK